MESNMALHLTIPQLRLLNEAGGMSRRSFLKLLGKTAGAAGASTLSPIDLINKLISIPNAPQSFLIEVGFTTQAKFWDDLTNYIERFDLVKSFSKNGKVWSQFDGVWPFEAGFLDINEFQKVLTYAKTNGLPIKDLKAKFKQLNAPEIIQTNARFGSWSIELPHGSHISIMPTTIGSGANKKLTTGFTPNGKSNVIDNPIQLLVDQRLEDLQHVYNYWVKKMGSHSSKDIERFKYNPAELDPQFPSTKELNQLKKMGVRINEADSELVRKYETGEVQKEFDLMRKRKHCAICDKPEESCDHGISDIEFGKSVVAPELQSGRREFRHGQFKTPSRWATPEAADLEAELAFESRLKLAFYQQF